MRGGISLKLEIYETLSVILDVCPAGGTVRRAKHNITFPLHPVRREIK
jgi:hypothetical protein